MKGLRQSLLFARPVEKSLAALQMTSGFIINKAGLTEHYCNCKEGFVSGIALKLMNCLIKRKTPVQRTRKHKES